MEQEKEARSKKEEEARLKEAEEAKVRAAARAAARIERFNAAAIGLPIPGPEAKSGEWFYIMDGEVAGPILVEELKQKIDDPEITPPLKMIWTLGMHHWTPVYECGELWVH